MNQTQSWPQAPINLETLLEVGSERFEQQQLFFGHGTDNAWDEALWLALHALGLSWDCDQAVLQQYLDQAQVNRVTTLYDQRILTRKPAAYLTGRGYFAGLEFIVSEEVLVPRSPIAELIANEFQPWLACEPTRILDLCTGSACIGIACAHKFPNARVDCSDISTAALEIAQQNIDFHQLHNRVSAINSDVFSNLTGPYDLIVSNPPYVDAKDLAEMPAEFHAEPTLGLAAGNDGLDICRRILHDALPLLKSEGLLVVEVGNSWHALEQRYPSVPFTWLEFAHGGHGVFAMSAEEIRTYADQFR